MNQVEIGGERLWMVETKLDEALVTICCGTEERGSKKLLEDFVQQLPSTWMKFYENMHQAFDDYGHSEDFPPNQFFLSISRMKPGFFMANRSTLMVRFEFEVEEFSDSIPIYDFFVTRNLRISHHQAVF